MFKALKKYFNSHVLSVSPPDDGRPLSEAEKLLQKMEVDYTRQPDGTLVVPGHLSLFRMSLKELPDLSSVIVKGSFTCAHNDLTSLKGAPRIVEGDFDCGDNRLSGLEGTTITVGKCLNCRGNPLKSLAGAPEFSSMESDFGNFASPAEVPANLLLSAEEREPVLRLEETLLDCIRAGDRDGVIAALDRGADVKARGGLPLMTAAKRGDLPLAILLMAEGADFNQSLDMATARCRDNTGGDEDGLYSLNRGKSASYDKISDWLYENKAVLLEGFIAQRNEKLVKKNAELEQKVLALQEALAEAERPRDIGKPPMKGPPFPP